MNKKAEYGGNAMFQNNKKAAFLDYLMIIVGTALMATAINSVCLLYTSDAADEL